MILYMILGLLVGGLLNLLADLLPQHRLRAETPRCPVCQNPYPPWEWIATLSFLLLRSRCYNCGTRLALRRIFLEVAIALGFGLLWVGYGLSGQMFILSVYLSLFLLFLVIDIEKRIVPNRLVLPAMIFALATSPFYPDMTVITSLVGGIVGFGLFYLLGRLSRGGMGAGDVKLAGLVGLATGFPEVVIALLLASLLGGLVAMLLLATGKKGLRSHIPYAPFLALGGLAALFFGQQVVDWYLARYL